MLFSIIHFHQYFLTDRTLYTSCPRWLALKRQTKHTNEYIQWRTKMQGLVDYVELHSGLSLQEFREISHLNNILKTQRSIGRM